MDLKIHNSSDREGKKKRHWHSKEGEGEEGGCGKKEEKVE